MYEELTNCIFNEVVVIRYFFLVSQVMYFSSIFPYVVLFCFLVRGFMLDGASEGITYMFYPKVSADTMSVWMELSRCDRLPDTPFVVFIVRLQLEIWGDVQVWRQAATQVFFALGLGFGSIIAYSSYNPKNNNCHRDAFTVSFINFLTSVLATLVVFAVLGFRAKENVMACVLRSVLRVSFSHIFNSRLFKHLRFSFVFPLSNVKKLSELSLDPSSMPNFNYSDPKSVSLEVYTDWFKHSGSKNPWNLTKCDLEKEMQKVK